MFCPKCGNQLPEQVKFCPKCGASVSNANASGPVMVQEKPAAAAEIQPPKAQKKKGKGGIVALAVVLVVAVVVAAAVFLVPKLPDLMERTPADGAADVRGQDVQDQDDVQDPNVELLAIIDRVEEAHAKAMEAYPESSDEDDDAAFVITNRKRVDVLNGFLADLEELRTEAAALSGLDAKLKSAGDAYFSMLRDAREAHVEALTFLTDYIELYDNVLAYQPLEVDYDYLTEYSEALTDWLLEAREGYAAISYPSCVESEWKQYGEILDYNASIAEKVELAVEYNDWLRFYSTRYMSSRYIKMEENQYNKLLDCIGSEIDHANNQWAIASRLAEEVHTYWELSPGERETYEFANDRTGKILLNYDVVDTIYPSLYNTYDAFAIFKTGCISGTRSIVVEAEIDGFTQVYRESFNLDSSYKAIYIKPPALTGDLNLSSAKPAQLKITISEKDGTLIDAKTFPVTLKSETDFDWYSDEYGSATQDNILCFLTPEAKAITDLKRTAAGEIKKITGGEVEKFWGYQIANANWNQYLNTYLQAAGLMSALNEMGVRYVMNPFSISDSGQHITLPEDVIENRSGLCIETSLVVASALQSAGMHAFLVFPRGHAMVAVEVWNSGDNAGEYFLIETTAIEESADIEMFNASANVLYSGYVPSAWEHDSYALREPVEYLDSDRWADYVENYFEYVIDCNDSRLLGLTPFAN